MRRSGNPTSSRDVKPALHVSLTYFRLKKEASPGVDGETWRSYGEQLEIHLQKLCERLKQGAYRAKPVRRVYIPKADGRQRPLGVTIVIS
jgi:retron-type reverse transcriptase